MANSHNSLKIGLVLDDSLDKPDGVQQYVLAVGKWLGTQGHEVHYLVGETKRSDIKNVHSLSRNLSVRFNKNRMSIPLPTSGKKLKAFMAAQQFDVIHVQMPYSPQLAHRLILAAGGKTAVIGTFHIVVNGQVGILGTRILGHWSRKSLKRFDKLFSVSEAAATFSRQTYKINSDVLPNVIDYDRFASAKKRSEYVGQTVNILFLGRLVPRKGCQILLEAISELSLDTDLPKFRVIVCGKGPLLEKLMHYSSVHDLDSKIEFVGFVSEDDKPSYFASADISVFPSSGGESFGIVLLEAMASGQSAILAGDNPGYRSVLSTRPELLFSPKDSHALAKELRLLIIDQARRKQIAEWGKEFTTAFDTAIVGTKLLDAYNQALRKRTQR